MRAGRGVVAEVGRRHLREGIDGGREFWVDSVLHGLVLAERAEEAHERERFWNEVRPLVNP